MANTSDLTPLELDEIERELSIYRGGGFIKWPKDRDVRLLAMARECVQLRNELEALKRLQQSSGFCDDE